MNNEPVAWMNSKGDIILPAHQANKDYNIPLYTHPVKELTDEEIHDLMDEIRKEVADDIERAMYRMARAILRKAQATCNGFCGDYECKENQGICKRKAQEK